MKACRHRMSILLSTALSVACLQPGHAKAGEPTPAPVPAAATGEVPFLSCTLSAFNGPERWRHGELLGRLRTAATERRELPDGYAFCLGSELPLAELAEWISLERRCCPFFGFRVEAKPGQEDVWLNLTGGGEVKAFIQAVVLTPGARGDTDAPQP